MIYKTCVICNRVLPNSTFKGNSDICRRCSNKPKEKYKKKYVCYTKGRNKAENDNNPLTNGTYAIKNEYEGNKICSECGIDKLKKDYYICVDSEDGLYHKCKSCCRTDEVNIYKSDKHYQNYFGTE